MKRQLTAILAAALCLGLLGGCAAGKDAVSDPPAAGQTGSVSALPTDAAGETPAQPSGAPEFSETPEISEAPEPSPMSDTPPYEFGQPVEESDPVDGDYFDDAVFLGDSRTEGLQLYSGLKSGDFFWHKGMTVFRVDDPERRVIEVDGQKMTMMEALALKQYAKVYIMIGINELGYPVSSYSKGLRAMVDKVKELQPDAVIYLQTLPPVNEEVAKASGLGDYINNANVSAFNDVVARTAADKQVALLDTASVFRTENGDLDADMAADGVHFRRAGYQIWYEYLRTHTLTAEEYAAAVPAESDAAEPSESTGN